MAAFLPGDGLTLPSPDENNEHPLPPALQEPKRKVSLGFQLLYGGANATIGIGNITFFTVLLPTKIAHIAPTNQTNTFIVISSLGACAAILTNPLIGRFSDRTTSSWGRRRPWLLVGMMTMLLSMLELAAANTIVWLTLGSVLLQIAVNILLAALSALLPDQVPLAQRATVSAVGGMAPLVGGLLGQVLVGHVIHGLAASFLDLGILSIGLLLVFCLILREQRLPRESAVSFRWRDFPTSFWLNPLTHRDFALTWLARCLIFLASTTVINYLFYYLVASRLFAENQATSGVQIFYVLYVAAIVFSALVCGKLSDHFQCRKIFVMSASMVMTIGVCLLAFFPFWSTVLLGAAVIGVGFGAYLACDLALASQLLPHAKDRGKDFALMNAAIFFPMLIAPALASVALGLFQSYTLLLGIIALGTGLAVLLILPIRSVR